MFYPGMEEITPAMQGMTPNMEGVASADPMAPIDSGSHKEKKYASWVWALLRAANNLQESVLNGQLADATSAKASMGLMLSLVNAMNKDLEAKAKAVEDADKDHLTKAQTEYQKAQTKWQTAQGMENTMVSAETSAVQTDAQTSAKAIDFAGTPINIQQMVQRLLSSIY